MLQLKIVIYGLNDFTDTLVQAIDKQKCNIIACVDTSNTKVNDLMNGICVISVDQLLMNDQYDYIINGDFESGSLDKLVQQGFIQMEKVFDYMTLLSFVGPITSPEFFHKYYSFIHNKKDFEGLITGLSYAQLAIDCSSLSRKFFNFANPAQDLFYDFEMMKFAYKFPAVKNNLKYVIIGISYYSFQYDLSLSINSSRSLYYFPIVNLLHNLKQQKSTIANFNYLSNLAKNILHADEKIIYKCLEKYYAQIIANGGLEKYDFRDLSSTKKIEEVVHILKDFDKNYPETVKENINILSDYLQYLKERNITAIVVVCPATDIYNSLIPTKMKNEFYEIIQKLKKQYEFQFLDYISVKNFEDKDFRNASHMNAKGAAKFTKILESEIRW